MSISQDIFKTYDIRGIYSEQLNEALALTLGRVFGTWAIMQGESKVAVGRDGRLSGPILANALMQGLVDAGITVLDAGLTTSPQLYFAAQRFCESGIQVTGSHNPRDYNGFKMLLKGRMIFGDEIQSLRKDIEGNHWAPNTGGCIESLNMQSDYQAAIAKDIELSRPMTVVVDSGNGVAGATAPQILRAIGCQVIELFSEVDGRFPNHHPDPGKPENLATLIQTVKATNAELGLAFDGDGDRLGVVTKEGNVIFPDRQLMLFAKDLLEREGRSTIVYDVKCSQQLAPFIKANGGNPFMFKTGHSLIKTKMKEIGAKLGGEMSGHIFFFDRWGFDDGTYAACRLLEILSRFDNPSQILNDLPNSYSTPEITIACDDENAHNIVEKLIQTVSFSSPAKISTIDGLRVDWPDGFGLIRASNTTPVLVLRFEGVTEKVLKRIQQDMLEALQQIQPSLRIKEKSFESSH